MRAEITLLDLVKNEALAGKAGQVDNFGGFLTLLESGGIKYPNLSAYDLVKLAINTPRPELKESGYFDYPVFTGRDDRNRIFGIAYSIDRLGSYVNTIARMKDKERILLVVGPSGAGKSMIADIFSDAVEKKAAESGPFFAIKDCLVRDNPLKLLGPQARARIMETHKVHIDGTVCPDCQTKWVSKFSEPDFNILDIPVEEFEYSAKLGVGITRLGPKDTKPLETESWKRINRIVFGSCRGVLIADEVCELDTSFLRTNHDFFRGRRFKVGEKIYDLDAFIIGTTTTKEWQVFQAVDSNIPLIERTGNVYIPYNTSVSNEVLIYEKTVGAFLEGTTQHIAPGALEFLAEVAVRSRLKGSDYITNRLKEKPERKKNVTQDAASAPEAEIVSLIKMSLYDGRDIAGFTQSQDIRIIEEEGLKKQEGMEQTAISPVFMSGKLYMMLNDYKRKEGSCLSTLKAHNFLQELIDNTPQDFLKNRPHLVAGLPFARKRYENWLVEEVKTAFVPNFEERLKIEKEEYIKNIEILLDPRDKSKMSRNPITRVLEPIDIKYLDNLEDKMHGRTLNAAEREEFRRNIYNNNPAELPKFNDGIEAVVRSAQTSKAESLLTAISRNDEDEVLYQEARQRLVDSHGFCKICVAEAMDSVASIINRAKK